MRPALTTATLLAGVMLVSSLAACPGRGPTDETPEGAVKLFVQAAAGRPRNRQKAYDLLAPSTQKTLAKRAGTASKQAGRKIEPTEMLAIERAVIRWKITKMDAEIDGDRATVTARGKAKGESTKLSLRQVDGHWRIVLPL